MKRTDDLRAARKLGKAEVLQRLASVPFGRVVFTRRALPGVVITGHARIVDDPGEAGRCRAMMHSWLAGDTGHVIQIEPEIVTGFELCRAGPAAA
jgi:hypothetical protein